MLIVIGQCVQQIIDLNLKLICRAMGCHGNPGRNIFITVTGVQLPFNGDVEGVGLQLFFMIMEKGLNLILVILPP
ncbi:hypothetical protein D3C75_359800 [compost metagenome]